MAYSFEFSAPLNASTSGSSEFSSNPSSMLSGSGNNFIPDFSNLDTARMSHNSHPNASLHQMTNFDSLDIKDDMPYAEMRIKYANALKQMHEQSIMIFKLQADKDTLVDGTKRLEGEKSRLAIERNTLMEALTTQKRGPFSMQWGDPNLTRYCNFKIISEFFRYLFSFCSTSSGQNSHSITPPPGHKSHSLAPSDSISHFDSPDITVKKHQPAIRPSQYPPDILWCFEDCQLDDHAGLSSSNPSQPKMEKSIQNPDGTMIGKGSWNAIMASAHLVKKDLLALHHPDKSVNQSRKSMTFFHNYFPVEWQVAIDKLEGLQPVLCLCASHWKAEHVLSNLLRRANRSLRNTGKKNQISLNSDNGDNGGDNDSSDSDSKGQCDDTSKQSLSGPASRRRRRSSTSKVAITTSKQRKVAAVEDDRAEANGMYPHSSFLCSCSHTVSLITARSY